jgi:hypothetical protein
MCGNIRILNQLAACEAELSLVKFKLDSLADAYKEIEHKNQLLNMALDAANSKSVEDYCPYYAYDPDQGTEQLKSLCNVVTVHIPAVWLVEILEVRDARIAVLVKALQAMKKRLVFLSSDAAKDYSKDNSFWINLAREALSGKESG